MSNIGFYRNQYLNTLTHMKLKLMKVNQF